MSDSLSKEICRLINSHYKLFGSTQMPVLQSKLSGYKQAAAESNKMHVFRLIVRHETYFDGLCIDDLVFLMAIVHDFNDSSLAEVFAATEVNPSELCEVFSATGLLRMINVRGEQITHSRFEQSLFKALTYTPSHISDQAIKIGFQETSALAGLVSSGVAEHSITQYLDQAWQSGRVDQNLADDLTKIGWLGDYCADPESLPNHNAAHYLRATAAFHPLVLMKRVANSGFWEDLIISATARGKIMNGGHPVSQSVMETISHRDYLDVHCNDVSKMLNSLFFADEDHNPSSDEIHLYLSKRFSGTDLYEHTQSPHFLLKMARSALHISLNEAPKRRFSFDEINKKCPHISERLTVYRYDLANEVLRSMIGIDDDQFGFGLLTIPFGLASISRDDGSKPLDPLLLQRYLVKTVPLAQDFIRERPDSAEDRGWMQPGILNTYRYLIGLASKDKTFDWSFEKALTEDQRQFLVRSGASLTVFGKSSDRMRETAISSDLGL